MALTERDIMQLLREYSRTPEGKKLIADHGYGSGEEVDRTWLKELAEELRSDINEAFKSVTTSHAYLTENLNLIRITSRVVGKKGAVFTLVFPPEVLGRLSLEGEKKVGNHKYQAYYTGSVYHREHAAYFDGLDDRYGVYDIIGLFTHGYKISENAVVPKGHWLYADASGEIMGEARISSSNNKVKARESLGQSNFIQVTINKFVQRHRNEFPDLRVEYPAWWGGTK